MKRQLFFILVLLIAPIYVFSQAPVASFTSDKTSGCPNTAIQFTSTSTGGSLSYSWDFGDGTGGSAVANPVHTYISSGTYTIILTVSNSSGSDVETKVGYITIHPLPTVDFTATPLAGCPPLSVNFTDNSTPNVSGPATYSWGFGDGAPPSTQQNPTHLYLNPGSYNVSLTVTNSQGCAATDIKTQYILVHVPPTGSFTSNSPCKAPGTVNFSAAISNGNPPYTYSWDFGDNSPPGSGSSPSHTYTNSGSYTATMVVTDANGCKDTVSNTVNVGTLNASFITVKDTYCINEPVLFINGSTNAAEYDWDFDDGNTATSANASHTYTASGTYTILLTAYTFGKTCTDTFTKTIYVKDGPFTDFSFAPANLCPAPDTVSFTNLSVGAVSYQWSVGGTGSYTSTNPTHVFNAPGPHIVTLRAFDSDGCFNDKTITISLPNLNINIDYNKPYNPCLPATINFNILYNSSTYNVLNATWDFGDGSPIVSGLTPAHTFTDTGLHVVKLTAHTQYGCVVEDTVHLLFGNPTSLSFTRTTADDTVCYGSVLKIYPQSTNATKLQWWVGSPNKLGVQTTPPDDSFQVRVLGMPYSYIIGVASHNGCNDTAVDSVYMLPVFFGPILTGWGADCDTLTKVKFGSSAFAYTHIEWDFGDGSPKSYMDTPTHRYPGLGTYFVNFLARNDSTGCDIKDSFPVTLGETYADFWATDTAICAGDTIHFSHSFSTFAQIGQTPIGPYYTFSPQTLVSGPFGPLDPPLIPDSFYVFPKGGIYDVTLHYIDMNGCHRDTTKQDYITVGEPLANFVANPYLGCDSLTVNFSENGSNTQGVYTTIWDWDFGDGNTANLNADTTSHHYPNPGKYDVRVIVTDNIGCVDTLIRNQYIDVRQTTAAFDAKDTSMCIGDVVEFYGKAMSFTNDTLYYTWDFGDGSPPAIDDSPTHVYTQLGSYTVRLIVTDDAGCSDTLVYPNYIDITKPTASFTISDTFALCPPLNAQFTNTSTGAVDFRWDFGDGSSPSIVPNPTNVYVTPGVYTIRLIAINADGCSDTAYGTVEVLGYAGALTYTPLKGCDPLKVNFSADLKNVTHFYWDFSDGTIQIGNGDTASHVYTTPGRYVPKLVFTDSAGCVNSSQGLDTVFVDDVIADMFTTPACIHTPVTFNDNSQSYFSNITHWSWDINNGQQQSNMSQASTVFSSPGTYPVVFTATNGNGCKDTLVSSITVHPLPTIRATGDTTICLGDEALIQGHGGQRYSWQPSSSVSCDTCATTYASPTKTTHYIVTGTDGNGCKNKDTVNVAIQLKTTSSVGLGGAICKDSSIQLHASGATSYEWQPSSDLDDAFIANPTASPQETTTYMVIAREGSCIPDSQEVEVIVHPLPTVNAGSDQTIVAGKSVNLNASGSLIATYSWSPSTSLNCSDCSSPLASPTATTVYTITVTSAKGCRASDDVMVQVLCDESQVFIPNTFSPNGDGENDVFYPRGVGLQNIRSFRIYNRWGELVYERKGIQLNDASLGWDGSYKGNQLNPDVFMYIMEGQCEGGEMMNWKGDVSLIR